MTSYINDAPVAAGSNSMIPEPSSQVHTTTLTPGSTSTRPLPVSVPVNHNEKPEKFGGLNFKTW